MRTPPSNGRPFPNVPGSPNREPEQRFVSKNHTSLPPPERDFSSGGRVFRSEVIMSDPEMQMKILNARARRFGVSVEYGQNHAASPLFIDKTKQTAAHQLELVLGNFASLLNEIDTWSELEGYQLGQLYRELNQIESQLNSGELQRYRTSISTVRNIIFLLTDLRHDHSGSARIKTIELGQNESFSYLEANEKDVEPHFCVHVNTGDEVSDLEVLPGDRVVNRVIGGAMTLINTVVPTLSFVEEVFLPQGLVMSRRQKRQQSNIEFLQNVETLLSQPDRSVLTQLKLRYAQIRLLRLQECSSKGFSDIWLFDLLSKIYEM